MNIMRHDSHGWWLRDAGLESVQAEPPLNGGAEADVVIVGGGYSGMWAAWFLSRLIEPERILLLEGELCGTGPSGRNGGFCQGLGESVVQLEAEWGTEAARALIETTADLAHGVGEWALDCGLEVDFCEGGQLIVSCGVGQSEGIEELIQSAERVGLAGEFKPLTAAEVQGRCASPAFRDGLFARRTVTVHPGKLALGLRSTLIDRGIRIHELSPARSIGHTGSGVEVVTPQGRARAASGVLACGVATADWPGLRREATMTSSHMVITEPVPDVLDSLGWRGGEAIIDGRTLVHYFRTTSDDRIAFGWGGGMVGRGVRPGLRESMDLRLVSKVAADLQRFFPQLEGRKLDHAWGGPIDASPTHIPAVRPLGTGRWHAAFGYTGNGVGPSRSCGQLLAQLALDPEGDAGALAPLVVTEPRRLPPEPFRWLGGSTIMEAIDRVERVGSEGGDAGPIARAVASLPERLGYSIGR